MDQENQPVETVEYDDKALAELIKRVGEGDTAAFAALYDSTGKFVFGLVRRFLPEETVAEETLLDIYTRIRKESANYNARNFLPLEWIVTNARASCVARLNATEDDQRRTLPEVVKSDSDMTAAPAIQRMARSCMASLTDSQRDALDWIFFAGLSLNEIAEQIGKPLGAVRTHTRIAIGKLYDMFRPLYERGGELVPTGEARENAHEKPTEEIRKLVAFSSLGILAQQEARSFETHIEEGCKICEIEHLKFKHIVAEIGMAANEIPPPDQVGELILSQIKSETPSVDSEEEPAEPESQSEPEPQSESEPVLKSEPEPVPEPEPQPEPKPAPKAAPKPFLGQSPANRPSIFPWILAAILAVVAVLAFLAYRSQQSANDNLNEQIASVRTELGDLQTLYDIQQGRRGELQQIISTVSKPETRILHLAGLAPAPSSSGAILWDVQENQCLVFGYMPPAAIGKAYQLWFLTPNAKIPSGTLKPDPSGRIYDWFDVPGNIASMTMVITLEPESGSQTPTLPYYAIGRND
ncbi:MAG: sigma-70 family RNA polymerase sigma factor [Acidobacteriota bacterium]